MGRHSEEMTKEQALHWYLDFGTDWVAGEYLAKTWADEELFWQACEKNGWLQIINSDEPMRVRITQQALDLFMKEGDQNVSVS